jgi:hypothetical protein
MTGTGSTGTGAVGAAVIGTSRCHPGYPTCLRQR